MAEHSDPHLDYALKAIHDAQVRETEEFRLWMEIPENRALFGDLLACREALMREKLEHKQKLKVRIRRWSIVSASVAAAAFIGFFLIPSLSSSSLEETAEPARFFSAIETGNQVILQTDGQDGQLLHDSVMDVKCWTALSADTVCRCCQTLVTPRGKDFLLILADGTKVWLNAESRLRYPVTFNGEERRVELHGEACFEVAKDEKHPFIVSADGVETKVLGTKFNVRSYEEADRHVTLVHGKVEVTNSLNGKAVVLQPGENLSYTEAGEPKVAKVNVAAYTAWTEGLFYFEDMPLQEIMRTIGRWYNVNIDFEQPELYGIKLNFWADRRAGIEEALGLLNRLKKVNAEYQNGTITIRQL